SRSRCIFVNCYFVSRTYFFFSHTTTTEIYTLSLHDALPILSHPERRQRGGAASVASRRGDLQQHVGNGRGEQSLPGRVASGRSRSEEHTSELQSRFDLVCRLLLEKKKQIKTCHQTTPHLLI